MNFITDFDPENGEIKSLSTSYSGEMIFTEKYENTLIKIIASKACESGKVVKVNLKDTKIEEIRSCTFVNCKDLTEVIFPDSLRTIKDNAFVGCSLTNVRIPRNTVNVDGQSFNQQPITCFEVDEDNQYFTSDQCFLMNRNKTRLVRAPETMTRYTEIPNFVNLESIGRFAFTSTRITSFISTKKLSSLDIYAFHCTFCMKKVDLSLSSIDVIPENCFTSCSAREIILPYNIKKIELYGLYLSDNIKKLMISSSLRTLNKQAIYKCDALKEIHYFGQLNFTETEGIVLDKMPTVYVVPGYPYATFSDINVTNYNHKLNRNTCIQERRRASIGFFHMILLFTRC